MLHRAAHPRAAVAGGPAKLTTAGTLNVTDKTLALARLEAGWKQEVLEWTGTPLASIEVAVVMDIPFEDAREQLSRVAVEHPVGFDGFWTLG